MIKVIIHRSPDGIKLFFCEYRVLFPSDEDLTVFAEMEVDEVEEKCESWEPIGRPW